MTTCTFIGSEQYDVDLYERIRAAVWEVVAGEDEIEFLFYRRSERFYLLCYFAVLHARHAFPGKKMTMTLFIRHGQNLREGRELPLWCFDNIIPLLLDKTPNPAPWTQIERYLIRQSNQIIAYCYPDLRWGQDRLFQYAVRRRNIRVMNVISRETAAFFKEAVAALPKDERDIVEKLNGGCTFAGLAKAAGLSVTAVRVRDSSGCRRLHSRAARRLEQERDRQGPRASVSCSVVLPGSASDEAVGRFRLIADLLTDCMGASAFLIEQADCPSSYMEVFRGRPDIERIVVTHERDRDDTDWEAVQKRYCPPCTQILNLGPETESSGDLESVGEMLSRSQYAICSLRADAPLNPCVRRCLEGQRGITLLDIGNAPVLAEPRPLP